MLKLDEKETLDPKISDLVKFSTLACLVWFYHSLLIPEANSQPILMFEYSFCSLGPVLQEYGVILPLGGL